MAGTGNWNETWRDTGFEGKIGRDGGISEPSTGPSSRYINERHINARVYLWHSGSKSANIERTLAIAFSRCLVLELRGL